MGNSIKYLSDIEKYEIININDGEKYSSLSNNDIIVDENGVLKYLIVNLGSSKFSLFSSDEYLEIEWENVKRIGAKTIILDVEEQNIRKTKL
ncbi:YlmC/YmxH family sporulation protein [Clostridium tarantellae]|uniref:YlmC/YmxH family sporulation protein n=1 Tax=Clostridium tarantellae TaxID=39493 RepID=A0A6I1MS08_9CLOT|nr:YlmC/YmxH family sporulation protein [Clostridium tarantellae]MPQ43671.1 YlmC/YmxH family sporulation protein [Clostridium tarantellae]